MSLIGSIIDGVGVVLVIFGSKSSNVVSVNAWSIVKFVAGITAVSLHDEYIRGVNPKTL